MANRALSLLLFLSLAIGSLEAQGVRSHTRPKTATTVTESQATDLSLTLNAASTRLIEQWVRTAGTIDESGRVLTASIYGPDAEIVEVGQRVRAFPPDSKSSMFQAWVTRVERGTDRTRVEVTLNAEGWQNSQNYVVEIIVERGHFLSVPNEALIEEGEAHYVYVEEQPGRYVPQQVEIGIQGERYTEVLSGLEESEEVVSFGSFFIDAEYKLKVADLVVSDEPDH
jgi:hypothetical protein